MSNSGDAAVWGGEEPTVLVNADNSYLCQQFTSTLGQTVFNITNFAYAVGTNSVVVLLNGVDQFIGVDFTESSGTSITFTSALQAGDLVVTRGIVGATGSAQAAVSAANALASQVAAAASATSAATSAAAASNVTAAAALITFLQAEGSPIASASTINLQTATGSLVHITGTTTINTITLNAGAERTVIFDSALTLTASSTLLLPGRVNLLTEPGSSAIIRGDAASVVEFIAYTSPSGLPVTVPALQVFGDGSDGNVTINTAITLSRDMYYANLTLGASASINTGGYRIFVSGILDISAAVTGAIYRNGANGLTNGSPGGSVSTTNLGGSPTAGVGSNSGSPGGNGAVGANGGSTLAAGAGYGTVLQGTGVHNNGGTAETNTIVGSAWPNIPLGLKLVGTTFSILLGGASGSGGGSSVNTNIQAGGGGSGGGVIAILANTIAKGTNTNQSIIQAIGGNGGAGNSGVSATDGGSGGGSGGGGGWIILVYKYLTGSVITGAVDVSGGNGGAGGAGHSTCYGGSGGASGGTGIVHMYNLSTGTMSAVTSTAGTLGTFTGTNIAGAAGTANPGLVNL